MLHFLRLLLKCYFLSELLSLKIKKMKFMLLKPCPHGSGYLKKRRFFCCVRTFGSVFGAKLKKNNYVSNLDRRNKNKRLEVDVTKDGHSLVAGSSTTFKSRPYHASHNGA